MRKVFSGCAVALLGSLLANVGCSAGALDPAAAPSSPSPSSPQPAVDGSQPASSGSAELSIHLVDGPLERLQEVNVEVLKVSLVDRQGMLSEVGAPMKVIDLLKLRDGISETLGRVRLGQGSYVGLRLLLGTKNTVRLADGSVHPLKVPSGQQSGIKLSLNLEISGNENASLFIDFDVAESIHIVSAGRNDQYILRPVLRAIEQRAGGTVKGQLTIAGQAAPLAGATIYAESRDAQGQPQIVRRAQTGSDGRYELNLLPLDAAYDIVVSQTLVHGVTYQGMTRSPILLNREHPTATFDTAVTAAVGVGSLAVEVSPMAGEQEGDTCMVLQGDEDSLLIVASDVTTREAKEQVLFDGLPVNSYKVRCVRRSIDSSGGIAFSASQPAAASVAAVMTTLLQISF